MKRFLSAAGMIVLSVVLIGCGHDTHEGLIQDTVVMMNAASTQVKNISDRVKEATERYKTDSKKGLDLTDALKAADELKKTGNKALQIKQAIDQYRKNITDEDQKINAEKQKDDIRAAFKKLYERRDELRAALAEAEKLDNGKEKAKVEALRDKIVEAEGPYESLTR